jgi:hypothetical protein
LSFSRNLNIVTITSEDIRKAEKERLSYDKDLRAAAAVSKAPAKAARSSKSGSAKHSKTDEEPRDGRLRRSAGSSRGSGGGKAKSTPVSGVCFRCGSAGHKADSCTKPYSK